MRTQMLLYKLERMWDNIPSVSQLAKKYKVSEFIIISILLFLSVASIFFPSFIGQFAGYWVTLLIKIACEIAWLYLLIITVKDWSSKIARKIMYVILFLVAGFSLVAVSPLGTWASTPDKFDEKVTYVTYDMSCPYCRKAHLSTKAAISMYNSTHGNKIVLVDLAQDSKIAKELKKRITYKGTILNVSHNKQGTYTLRDEKKKPKSPSPEYIWELLKTYND